MNDVTKVFEALRYAMEMHEGQVDKSGVPYILHPLRVAAAMACHSGGDVTLTVAAALHDVVEDTIATHADLEERFGVEVADLVLTLTHADEETYFDYIKRLSEDDGARRVKVFDILDNLREPFPSESLRKRYEKALAILASGTGEET